MNKYEFLQNLQRALPHLAPADQAEIVADFEEHFAAGQAAGKSEAEICEELGSPYDIAQQDRESRARKAPALPVSSRSFRYVQRPVPTGAAVTLPRLRPPLWQDRPTASSASNINTAPAGCRWS